MSIHNNAYYKQDHIYSLAADPPRLLSGWVDGVESLANITIYRFLNE